MTEPEPSPKKRRRFLPIFLVVLAAIIGFLAIFALWAKRQLLEEQTFRDTSTELIQDPVIQDAVATYAVDELYSNVDVQGLLQQRLETVAPRLAAPLSGALSGAIRQLADSAAHKALAEPKVQDLWVNLTSGAQQKVIQLLEDKNEFVSTTGGVVTLDLRQVVATIASQTGLPDLSDKLPPDVAQLEIMRSDDLSAAQTVLQLLKTLAWVLTALTLLLFALAIAIARDRRRETLRAAGIAFIVIGVLVLFVHSLAGTAVTTSLANADSAEPAIAHAWTIGTSLLRESAQSVLLYGIVIVLAAWIAGPTRIAVSFREAITPYFRRPAVAYGSLAALLLVLFWWDPVIGTHRLVSSLILIALLALGFELLRRQVIREFPDRVTTGSPGDMAQRMADRMKEARERRVTAPAATSDPGQVRIEQLERLAKLHESGVLSDEELASEKQRVLQEA